MGGGGSSTPDAATFRKICMSKRKNLDPRSANGMEMKMVKVQKSGLFIANLR